MIISFAEQAWHDYNEWAVLDKKIFKRIQRLIKETVRDPFGGIGKPEPLRGDLAGFWSKRIDDEHRLVYQAQENQLIVIACKYHYVGVL